MKIISIWLYWVFATTLYVIGEATTKRFSTNHGSNDLIIMWIVLLQDFFLSNNWHIIEKKILSSMEMDLISFIGLFLMFVFLANKTKEE
ncbi:MAG: hypothetical protein ACOYLO_00175 [Ferruginibacter sp.]